MQDREKKLAIGLGGILALALAFPLFEGWFLAPISDAENTLASTQEQVAKLTDSETELKQSRRNLEDWKYESLPPDPFTAQREYQEWLMDLARMSGFSQAEPTLGSVPTKGRTFIEIPVTIEAKATIEQLARFLYHFERAALLHRVQTLDVTSPASIGNPLLDVTILARGLSLVDAPARSRLFPTTALLEDITTDGQTLQIDSLKGFPLVDGFQLKIGEELMKVSKRGEGDLTVERAVEGTVASAHQAGSLVELFPIDREVFQSGRTFEEYVDLLENNPFTKPSPPVDYQPELSPNTAQTVTRGEPWTLPLKLTGWDPSGGPAVYSLEGDTPQGLTIDEKSGELTWDPAKDVEAKLYNVDVTAKSDILSGQQVQVTLPVTLREPNLPPTIEKVDSLTAFSGRPLTIPLQADDPDGENDAMKYSLSGEVPTGATIDEQGVLTWIPPLTLDLGDYKITTSVADSGDPQQTTTQEVTIKLEDDAALFTKLVGVFYNGESSEAMLRNLTSGKTTRLGEGAELTAADLQGTIVELSSGHIIVQVGEEKFRLDVGNNLRQMTPTEAARATPPASDSASG